MDSIRNVVAIVDPTRKEQPAVSKAAQLAVSFGATLELFACDTSASVAARRASHALQLRRDAFAADLRPVLENIALPLRAGGLVVNTSTVPIVDNLASAILKHVDVTADFVVKDTHHHSVARRTFLSNTDWQLIRQCRVPLLLAKSKTWSANPCIVAAIDPGHVNDKPATLDRRILGYASLVTKQLGGDLHIAHAYLPESVIAQAMAGEPPMVEVLAAETLQLEEQRKRVEVTSLLDGFQVPAANMHVKIGSAIELLRQLAEMLPADVVVMGAVARSGLGRAFIGSTAEDILERLPCDALIIKTPDFGDSLPF